MYSPTLEVAGRFDCMGEYKGVPSIIDFKTAMNKLKGKADIKDYRLQLAFYALERTTSSLGRTSSKG